jgi:hypothetical protein
VRIADALNGRNIEFALADLLALELPGAQFHGALESALGIVHTNADRADARAVLLRVAGRERIRLRVDEEVHLALAVQRDVLADVARNGLEAETRKGLIERLRVACGEFDELEARGAERIVLAVRGGVLGGGGIGQVAGHGFSLSRH